MTNEPDLTNRSVTHDEGSASDEPDVTTKSATRDEGSASDESHAARGESEADDEPAAVTDKVSVGVAWRILRADTAAWSIGAVIWLAFYILPLPIGLAALAFFDRADD
ncbi:MAG: hypothetical protein M3517_08590, partial [Actinomycetota bacterium]|nr:hypothetical protein [Actinomycetota bacterium]